MSELPKGWLRVPIGQLVDLNPKNRCEDETTVGFVPLNRLGIRYRDRHTFEQRRWADVKKGYTHFQDGDVLLARITPCFENGKAGIAAGLPNGFGAGSTEYFVLRPRLGTLDGRYLLAFLKTASFMLGGERVMSGAVGQQRVPKQYLLDAQIPLAPYPEQARISAKLDLLFHHVDRCRERLERVPLLLKRYREAVLEAAVSGSLTGEWRRSRSPLDSAPELKSMATQKEAWVQHNPKHNEAHRILRTATEFDAASLSDDGLPTGWHWAALQDVCLMIVDCHNKTAPYTTHGIPLIRTSNVRDGHFVHEDMKFVSAGTYAFWSRRCPPEPGDIIFTREAPIAESAIIPKETRCCLGQRTMLFRFLRDRTCVEYVLSALQSPSFRAQAMNAAVGTGVKHLRVGDVGALQVAVPPFDEQREIARRVQDLLQLGELIEQRCKDALRRVEQFTPAILMKAFRGELVPQDPRGRLKGEQAPRAANSNYDEEDKAESVVSVRPRGRRLATTDREC